MTTKNFRMQLFLSLILIFVICGCGSYRVADQDARKTALIVNQRVLALKAQVRQKMDAERKYYANQIATIHKSKTRTDYTTIQRKVYKEAEASAKSMRKDGSAKITDSAVATKLAANAKNLVKEFGVSEQKLLEWRAKTEKNIKELKKLEQEYSALERTLVKMSIPPDRQDEIIRVGTFIADAAKHYNKLEKERKKKEETK